MVKQNQTKYLLNKFLLILVFIHSSNCCLTGLDNQKYREFDHENERQITWLVIIDDDVDDYFALAYGALVHPKAVVSAGVYFDKFYIGTNYYVERDCGLENNIEKRVFNCTRRQVSYILYDPDSSTSNFEKTWSVLILERPFDVTPTIAPINLVNSLDVVDTNNCFFTRWMRVVDEKKNESGIIIEPYYTIYVNGKFLKDRRHPWQLKEDRDWIIGEEFHRRMLEVDLASEQAPLNFMGSPLSCQFKNDSEKFALVGVATFRYTRYYSRYYFRAATRTGSYIEIINSYDKFMEIIKDSLQI